jgi:tetratricopeptide (TPR) repeat protein
LLETTEFGEATVRIGLAPTMSGRTGLLGFGSTVRDAIDLDTSPDWEFYGTAWLMAHYFLLDNPSRHEQTREYLRRYDGGEDPIEAFETSYGVSPMKMNQELVAYARRGTIGGLETPRVKYAGKLSQRALDREEALLLLADLAVELDRLNAAHRYFEEATELGGESPYRANLIARRSIAYIHERRVKEGDELIGQLLDEAPNDPQVLGDIAHYAFDKFVEIRTGRSEGSDTAELERAIQYGLRAVEADAANLEALYYLGLSYEAAGQLQNAADALFAGYDLNPSAELQRSTRGKTRAPLRDA